MTFNPALLPLLADWMINVSAGYFAVDVVFTTQRRLPTKLSIMNLLYSLAFFFLAYILTTIGN
jgi:hypothetical protein